MFDQSSRGVYCECKSKERRKESGERSISGPLHYHSIECIQRRDKNRANTPSFGIPFLRESVGRPATSSSSTLRAFFGSSLQSIHRAQPDEACVVPWRSRLVFFFLLSVHSANYSKRVLWHIVAICGGKCGFAFVSMERRRRW